MSTFVYAFIVLFACSFSFVSAQEKQQGNPAEKKSPKLTMSDTWRYLNGPLTVEGLRPSDVIEAKERFFHKGVNDYSGSIPGVIPESSLSKQDNTPFSYSGIEYLVEKKIKLSDITRLDFTEDCCPGYTNNVKEINRGMGENTPRNLLFDIDKEQWGHSIVKLVEKTDVQTRRRTMNPDQDNRIKCRIIFSEKPESIKIQFAQQIKVILPRISIQPFVSHNSYKLSKGPGDECWVKCVKKEGGLVVEPNGMQRWSGDTHFDLTDDEVVFIRGNVLIYLTSYIEGLGCMDLACKLDAFIVKQMHKAAEKR